MATLLRARKKVGDARLPLSMVALYSDQPVRARVRVKSESKVCCIFKYIKDHVLSNVSPVTEYLDPHA